MSKVLTDTPTTIQGLVAMIQAEIAQGNMAPVRATHLLNQLSALTGNIAAHVLGCEMAYNTVFAELLTEHGKENRAKVHAKTTTTYGDWQAALNDAKLVETLIASLKYLLRSAENEMRMSR
jgi:hypothetical protein